LAGRDVRYDKLEQDVDQYDEKVANQENLTEINKKLQETVNEINHRHGAKGIIRRQTSSYLFKKIIEKLVPSHVRYLIYSCVNDNGYFQKIRGRKLAKTNNPVKERGKFSEFIESKTKDPENHIWKEYSQICLNEEQIRSVKKTKAPVMKIREKISKEMQKLLDIRKKIMRLSQEMEAIFHNAAK
jgi:hypothetical protein